MRFGVMVGGHQSAIGVEGFIETAKDLEARGLDTMWIPHVFGHDSITLAALCGRETGSIELAKGRHDRPTHFPFRILELGH